MKLILCTLISLLMTSFVAPQKADSASTNSKETPTTLTIRLLNGKTGKPIANKNVTVRWEGDFLHSDETVVPIDRNGSGTFEVPKRKTGFSLESGPKRGKEPFRIAYLDCNEPMYVKIQVKQAVDAGFVPHNICSRHIVDPKPGVIIFWGWPKPWWRPDFQ